MTMYNLKPEYYQIYKKLFNAKQDIYFPEYRKVMSKALDKQFNEIQSNDFNLNMTPKYVLPIKDAMRDLYIEVGASFYKDLVAKSKSITYQTKNEDSQWLAFISQWIETTAGERITNITSTSLDIIRRQLDAGIKEGLSIDKIERNLRSIFTEFSKARSTMIARTEIIGASNLGSYEGALAQNKPMVKTWLAAIDSRTRDSHVFVHDQTVSKNDYFNVDGEPMKHPGDISASAKNVVNCRCTLTFRVL